MFVDGKQLIRIALGKGATAKTRFSLVPLQDVIEHLQKLDKDISNKYQMAALRKAAKPGMAALRSEVERIGSVTGNLLASVSKREQRYANNKQNVPVSVIVIGFRRPTGVGSQRAATPAFAGGTVLKGPNRAFHSHLVEFGTSGRRTPGKSRPARRKRVILDGRIITQRQRIKEKPENNPRGVLSSWRTRGPFAFGGKGIYPVDFIATGSVAPMPALRPLQKSFNKSRPQMQSILDQEMRKALAKALREQERRNQAGD